MCLVQGTLQIEFEEEDTQIVYLNSKRSITFSGCYIRLGLLSDQTFRVIIYYHFDKGKTGIRLLIFQGLIWSVMVSDQSSHYLQSFLVKNFLKRPN